MTAVFHRPANRRDLLRMLPAGAAALWMPHVFAEELARTAALGEGPFYPDKLPLDTDNDLLLVNDATTPAVGTITHLTGRVLNQNGTPVRNAFVEIWQVDHHGVYLHSDSADSEKRDANFQGYGRFLTDSKGQYYFRTVKPVPYPGRTPHIHFGVSRNGQRVFTTQMLVKGHPQNDTDVLFRRMTDPQARESLLVDFAPLPDSKLGAVAANFDIVLGVTAHEDETGTLRGGIGKPDRETRRRG
jgi:protocatechuate 3,4-dioxygenase beta subunit